MAGSQITIKYGAVGTASPLDITSNVLFKSARFSAQASATPDTFEVQVKDPDRTLSFTTGRILTLEIDGIPFAGYFLLQVGRTFAIPVDDTVTGGVSGVKTRIWILRGTDYNILFDKRVLRNPANYTTKIPNFRGDVYDDVLIKRLCDNYLDVASDLIDAETEVEPICCPFYRTNPRTCICDGTKTGAWLQQGSAWRAQMEDFANFTGAIWYLTPSPVEGAAFGSKRLVYKSIEASEAPWAFSDVPNKRALASSGGEPIPWSQSQNGPTYGFREIDAVEDSSYIVNDALVWGGSEWEGDGQIVFARETNSDSINTYRRWQYAETHLGEDHYKTQAGVDVRAWAIVNGPPGAVVGDPNRGLRFPSWNLRLSWFAHDVPTINGVKQHLRPGSPVNFILYTFGTDPQHPLIQTLPLRQVTVTFPGLSEDGTPYIRFEGSFSLQPSDSWTLWKYLAKNRRTRNSVVQAISVVTDASTSCSYGSIGQFAPTPSPDGTRTTFTVKFPYLAGSSRVWVNGLLRRAGVDYSESSPANGEITFFTPPTAGSWLWMECRTGSSTPVE